MIPPDVALLAAGAPRFGRTLKAGEREQWRLRECRLTVLPLRVKDGPAAIRQGLSAAMSAGCRIVALPKETRLAVARPPLTLSDGRLFALSVLPRRLDMDCPGWRKDQLCLSADDAFSCLAARLLAPYAAHLHIFGADEERREKLTRLLYRESGLIASSNPAPLPSSLIIAPPGEQASAALKRENAYTWQCWPAEAVTAASGVIPAHLAEALLLSAGGLPAANTAPLPLLSLLRRRGHYYEILPR